jgi:uncharacterized protein (TIGR02145 family)
MKANYTVLLIVFLFASIYLSGQHKIQKNLVSNPYFMGDTIIIKLDNPGDSILWQESMDLLNWMDIPGQNSDSLVHVVDTSKYIRASVVHGNCNPYFSDTLHILTNMICPTTTTDFDGNVYSTIQIGTQCWMKENLNAEHDASGTPIPRYCYGSSIAYCDTFGGLYYWTTIMNSSGSSNTIPSGIQGICPTGWHIPSDAEWEILVNYLGGDSIAGGKMKESGFAHWQTPNSNATNSSSFSALPGGYRNSTGNYETKGIYGFWWSSTEYSYQIAWCRSLFNQSGSVYHFYDYKDKGFAVRCIKD